MFQLFYEKVHQQIHRIVHCTHQLHEFNLAYLNNKDGAALLVHRVEPVRTQPLYRVMLRVIIVLESD